MNQLIRETDNDNYMQILAELNENHKGLFNQMQLSACLGISVRKLSDFKNGKLIDFWLLTQYALIIGREIEFNLKPL